VENTAKMSHDSPHAKKRRMTHSEADDAPPCLVASLPDHVLSKCFSFLGDGHYRFVSGTCRWFRDVYSEKYGENKTTFWENVISVACANLVFEDYKLLEKPQDEVKLAMGEINFNAVRIGKVDMLQWSLENGYAWNDITISWVGESGHAVKVLEWAESSNVEWLSGALIAHAASREILLFWNLFYRNEVKAF
jgi:hypothetical protein